MKKMLCLLGCLLAMGLMISGCSCNGHPGQGQKIGQIVKLSKGGVLFKTNEAQLIRGGLNGGAGAFGVRPFDFTIVSDFDAEKVRKFMDEQTEVIITYNTSFFFWLASSDSHGHFLVNIEPAPSAKANKPPSQ